MRASLITFICVCIVPFAVTAEVPWPFRSNAELMNAENIVVCSDFPELSAARLSGFLNELEQKTALANVVAGPKRLSKASSFNALIVVTGAYPQSSTQTCAKDTVPYGDSVGEEINETVERLVNGFEHPNPAVNVTLGETERVSFNYYHKAENWVTIVIAMREFSLNGTMLGLFDLPDAVCEHNPACAVP